MANARRFVHVYAMAREWLSREHAQRVLVLYARNNGSPWNPEAPVKVSCIAQVVAPGEEDTWERWQDWRCDPWYRTLLESVMKEGEKQQGVQLTTDINVAGVLKGAYEAQGTAGSVAFQIGRVPDEFGVVYVSLNFGRRLKEGEETLPEAEKLVAREAAARLASGADTVARMIQEGQVAWEPPR